MIDDHGNRLAPVREVATPAWRLRQGRVIQIHPEQASQQRLAARILAELATVWPASLGIRALGHRVACQPETLRPILDHLITANRVAPDRLPIGRARRFTLCKES